MRGGLRRGRGFFECGILQNESIVLLKGLESVAVNAVGASGLSVISIDVLHKDVPNQLVRFSYPFGIGHLHHVLV